MHPHEKLSYKTHVLRFTRESKFSFNQRIARKIKRYFATAALSTQRVCNGKAAYPVGFRSIFESIILLV